MNGDWVSGPETLPDEALGGNRYDLGKTYFSHPMDDDITRPCFPTGPRSRCRCYRLPTGAGSRCTARQFRGLLPVGNEAEVAGGARDRALDALLHGLWRRPAEAVLRLFSQGREERLEQAAACSSTSVIPARRSSCATRTTGRSRARRTKFHLASDAQKLTTAAATGSATVTFDALGDGVTLLTEPMRRGDRDHRSGRCAARHLVLDRGCRHLPRAAGVRARHEGSRVPGRARPAHPNRTRLAARLASQARQEAHLAVPALPYPRREAAAQARPGLRARHRDRPDLDRRPEGLPCGAERARRDYVYPGGSGGKLSNMKNEFTGADPSCTTTHATGLSRSMAARPQSISAAGERISCCCRSFPISRKRSRRRRRRARRPDAPRRLPSRLAAAERRYSPSRAIIGAA